jgi:hypothetical protein
MRNLGPQLFFLLLVVAAVLTLACGSNPPRTLQAVSVNPPTAVAATSLNDEIQFTATASYNSMPTPVTPAPAVWGACFQGANTEGVSVSANGLARCAAAGTYTVWAFVVNPAMKGACAGASDPCGGSCGGAVGTALLTCPSGDLP